MRELVHLPPILLGLLLASSTFSDHLGRTPAVLASILLTIMVNWTGWPPLIAALILSLFTIYLANV